MTIIGIRTEIGVDTVTITNTKTLIVIVVVTIAVTMTGIVNILFSSTA